MAVHRLAAGRRGPSAVVEVRREVCWVAKKRNGGVEERQDRRRQHMPRVTARAPYIIEHTQGPKDT